MCNTGRVNPSSVNPLCGQCLPNHSPINHVCVECRSTNGGLVFLIILVAFVFVALLHRLSRTSAGTSQGQLRAKHKSGRRTEVSERWELMAIDTHHSVCRSACLVSVFFYFIQVTIFMSGSLGVWLDWLTIFQMRPSAMSGLRCVMPMDEYQTMGLEICTIFILIGILLFYFLINFLLSTDTSRSVLGQFPLMRRLNVWWGEDPLASSTKLNPAVSRGASRGVSRRPSIGNQDESALESKKAAVRPDSLMPVGVTVTSDSMDLPAESTVTAAASSVAPVPTSWFYWYVNQPDTHMRSHPHTHHAHHTCSVEGCAALHSTQHTLLVVSFLISLSSSVNLMRMYAR
jgi:hypothetical protein